MKYLVPIYLVLLSIYSRGCSNQVQQNESLALPKDQKTPVEFADGSIQTTNGINFSRDGSRLYISNPVEKRFRNGRALAGILQYDYQNGQWYGPKLVEFEYEIDAYHPVLSFDNSTLFFNSRSHPDTINKSIPHNIWYARKSEDSWSRPKMVEGINSDAYDSYPSLAKNNNLYFNSDRPGGFGGMDIYLSNYENGIYQSPINLVNLNSEDVENDLVVDPHERFIIFNRYISST
ncbi:MAG: hypothetical protein OEM26_21955, partial [Saprospiraceae bacterium]|nr:hypothetical protein [Saprospiraceae bacterium]